MNATQIPILIDRIDAGHPPSPDEGIALAKALSKAWEELNAEREAHKQCVRVLSETTNERDRFRDELHRLQQLRSKCNRRKARRLARKMVAEIGDAS